MTNSAQLKPLSQRVGRIRVSLIKAMPLIAAQVGGCVSLGQGIPSYPTPAHIVSRVAETLAGEHWSGKYSLQPGMPELRQAVADYLRAEKGLAYDPLTEVGIFVGGMEALLSSILAIVDDGDEVLVPDPTYEPHLEQILLAGGRPVFVPLRTTDWGLDPAAMEAAITEKTKAIVVCNPANPTGGVLADDEVRALVDLAREHGLYLIADETYEHLVYGSGPPLSPAAVPGARENVILIHSFSKKYAMTGWRVGFAAAPERLMAELMKIHDSAAICAPTPSQIAALAALQGPQECVAEMKAGLANRRELMIDRLKALDGAFTWVEPKGAYYLMARYTFTDQPSYDLAVRLIKEAKVISTPGGAFGPQGEGHLRFSFGGEEAELNEAFDRIEEWMRNNQ